MQATRPLFAAKKHILICLDAFGTLFTPRVPIPVAYAKAAAQHGIECGDTETGSEVKFWFKDAFKYESESNPNYGKASGLGAEKWWGNVIRKTFTPFLKPDQEVPPALITDLLRQYSTKEGYKLYPEVLPFFRMLRKRKSQNTPGKIIVGIITNSDDRVPGILEDFGLMINPRRFAASAEPPKVHSKSLETLFVASDEDSVPSPGTNLLLRPADPESHDDVDFVILSYDVGHEKPDRRIFDAASSTLQKVLAKHDPKLNANDFYKLYVGDDLNKDYVGAQRAGWGAVLVDRAGILGDLHDYAVRTVRMDVDGVDELVDSHGGPVMAKVEVAKTLLGVRKYTPPIQDREDDPEGQDVLAGELREKTLFTADSLEEMRKADADENDAKG